MMPSLQMNHLKMKSEMPMKNSTISSSKDSGFHSLENDQNSPRSGGGRLTIFMLGRIYRWVAKAKIVALFSKSFMMGKPGEKAIKVEARTALMGHRKKYVNILPIAEY